MRVTSILLLLGAAGAAANWQQITSLIQSSYPLGPGNAQVTMYSTQSCGYCARARRYFDQQGVAYQDHDIERSQAARRAYQSLGGRGVPVIVIGDKVIHGFDEGQIRRALN
jgi:glutaredoxin-like YruB-family protein